MSLFSAYATEWAMLITEEFRLLMIRGQCRRKAIAEGRYAAWFKGFFEAGERRLPGDATSAAITDAVSVLGQQALERCRLQGNTIAEGDSPT